MKLSPLRVLLAFDAAVLFLLGALLILAPRRAEFAFQFKDLPEGVSYIIGLWGCVLVTMAIGYAVAATDPIRHVVWVQVGIARRDARMHSGRALPGVGRRWLATGGVRPHRRRADHDRLHCFLSAQATVSPIERQSELIRFSAMREIKFACPHCSQHIACDEGYCGYQIGCPSCEGGLIVPRLAAFGFGAATNVSLALPVAVPAPHQATATLSGTAWNEKQWDRHVAEAEGLSASSAWHGTILLLLFFTPALLALLFANSMSGHGGGAGRGQWLWTAWIVLTPVCSLLCAAGLSQTISKSVPVRVLITIVLVPLIWGLNASISLFLGCVAGLMSAAAQGS